VVTLFPIFHAMTRYAILRQPPPCRRHARSPSFPYHFASGWTGGLLPTFSFVLSAQEGNIYFGLWYPVAWIAVSFVVAMLFMKETKDVGPAAEF
jgi:hypothetical protein